MTPRSFALLLCVLLAGVGLSVPGAGSDTGVVTDTSDWIPWKHAAEPALAGSALDMSFLLDAPAGRHGFLKVQGDRFVFEDGTEARFWGGNLFGEANFPDQKASFSRSRPRTAACTTKSSSRRPPAHRSTALKGVDIMELVIPLWASKWNF